LQDSGGHSGLDSEQLPIPDKLYFKIGEVRDITGVEPHVLRYWESEIKVIRPQRASSKQRLYRRVDIENILLIKRLLHEDGFTIPGAKKYLSGLKKGKTKKQNKVIEDTPKPSTNIQSFCQQMKADLEEIRRMLET
jgi:DNA-binding transcriptional MerR regulator